LTLNPLAFYAKDLKFIASLCVVVTMETLLYLTIRPEQSILQGIHELEQADLLIGHNIIGYDIPLIQEQFPEFVPKGQCVDTLVLSRLFYPHIADQTTHERLFMTTVFNKENPNE
jgi:DNA polymerase III alpha subunit (gram-positive type)